MPAWHPCVRVTIDRCDSLVYTLHTLSDDQGCDGRDHERRVWAAAVQEQRVAIQGQAVAMASREADRVLTQLQVCVCAQPPSHTTLTSHAKRHDAADVVAAALCPEALRPHDHPWLPLMITCVCLS